MSAYDALMRTVLARLDPERAHTLAQATLRITAPGRPGRALLHRLVGGPDAVLRTHALGLDFSSPLGVAAGVDKEGLWFRELGALGFGFVEVGTITARSQPGNAKPRVARLLGDRALVNRMGFPNPGASQTAARLARHERSDRFRAGEPVVGVNVGKSRSASLLDAAEDMSEAVRVLAPAADYLVVNVSSPNTPGVRALQGPEHLRPLVEAIRAELAGLRRSVPLLVKLAPDLSDGELRQVAELALELELDGIVAVNTTIDRGGLSPGGHGQIPFSGGGVSGAPLRDRALEVLRLLHDRVGEQLTLISVGGVQDADDVWQRLLAGASLVQVYTAFVLGGPAWPRRINRELARRVRAAGAASIGEVVRTGSYAGSSSPASSAASPS